MYGKGIFYQKSQKKRKKPDLHPDTLRSVVLPT
jgi:hypothetical protein